MIRYCLLSLLNALFISLAAQAATIQALPEQQVAIEAYLKTHPVDQDAIQQEENKEHALLEGLSESAERGIQFHVPTSALPLTQYPVQTKSLTPGRVATRAVSFQLPNPIFIVGDDPQSKAWLTRYQQRLVKLHAKGIVVNVGSQAAMERLQAQFPNLLLIAMPGNAIASWLHLAHYPVLISNYVIEQ